MPKSGKIFYKSEKIFCHVLLAPAVSQRQGLFPPYFAISKMAEERVWVIFCNVPLMTLEYVHYV